MKKLPQNIIEGLTIILNNALNISHFPKAWKVAIVIPILKKNKDLNVPASYRPISLTSSLSKVLEILINKAINNHVAKHKLISDNQYGFKKKHSTVHAIHKLLSDISLHLTNRKAVQGAVLIDLEKAFDTVWLDGLLYKLMKMNFPKHLLYIIHDMLHEKIFQTKLNNEMSSTRKIIDGLQQGTINSPILFSLYANDVLELYHSSDPCSSSTLHQYGGTPMQPTLKS